MTPFKLPSRINAPHHLRGFAPWPHSHAYHPEATALLFLALFVACVAGLWSCWQFESGTDQRPLVVAIGAPL